MGSTKRLEKQMNPLAPIFRNEFKLNAAYYAALLRRLKAGTLVNPFTCNPSLRYAIFTAIQRAQI